MFAVRFNESLIEKAIMPNLLAELAEKLTNATADDQLLTLSEGYFKVRCIQVALEMQWIIQEGAQNAHDPKGGRKGRADYLKLIDGKLQWKRGDRVVSLAGGSADFTIVEPFQGM